MTANAPVTDAKRNTENERNAAGRKIDSKSKACEGVADVSLVTHSGREEDYKRYSRAFSDLESIINDVRNAACLMGLAAEDTVFLDGKDLMAQEIKARFKNGGLDMYVVHVLTQDQSDGLVYALYHVMNLSKQLRDQYYGYCEDGEAA